MYIYHNNVYFKNKPHENSLMSAPIPAPRRMAILQMGQKTPFPPVNPSPPSNSLQPAHFQSDNNPSNSADYFPLPAHTFPISLQRGRERGSTDPIPET